LTRQHEVTELHHRRPVAEPATRAVNATSHHRMKIPREAEHEGWLGEAEGLRVSLAAAKDKLAQTDNAIQRRNTAIELGLPSFPQIADRTVTATENQRAD